MTRRHSEEVGRREPDGGHEGVPLKENAAAYEGETSFISGRTGGKVLAPENRGEGALEGPPKKDEPTGKLGGGEKANH